MSSVDTTTRATKIWQDILDAPPDVTPDADRTAELERYIALKTEAGGAAPVS